MLYDFEQNILFFLLHQMNKHAASGRIPEKGISIHK